MVTITIDSAVPLDKTHFKDFQELADLVMEEMLEQKMKYAQENEVFIDY